TRLWRRLPSTPGGRSMRKNQESPRRPTFSAMPTSPSACPTQARTLCVQSCVHELQGGFDDNPDRLAAPLLTSAFAPCRSGDLNHHVLADTSPSATILGLFQTNPDRHGLEIQ